MSRKSWAAGDACSRAVNLALLVKKGEKGMPGVLSAKTWGFYDVLFKVRFLRGTVTIVSELTIFSGQTIRVPNAIHTVYHGERPFQDLIPGRVPRTNCR